MEYVVYFILSLMLEFTILEMQKKRHQPEERSINSWLGVIRYVWFSILDRCYITQSSWKWRCSVLWIPIYIYIYIYIYIVIHRQTVSFYQNSSVWLDTQDASNDNYLVSQELIYYSFA